MTFSVPSPSSRPLLNFAGTIVLPPASLGFAPSLRGKRFMASRLRFFSYVSSLVIFFSLTEAPLTDPTPTPPNTPETDPKRTRNRPETEPNGAKRSRTEPNGAEMDRNQALSGGTDGGVCREGGGGGCKGKRISLLQSCIGGESTITHKKITELIPKQFRFGNSSTQITEHNSQNNSVRDSVVLCSHFVPRPSNSRNNSVR